MKNLRKKIITLCTLALLAAPVLGGMLPKGWITPEPGISVCCDDSEPPTIIDLDEGELEIVN